jgi:penicillin-binding protein 2
MCVTEGTCQAINFPFVQVAAKTGTAQIGVNKDEVNSWVAGFWPYNNPKYAFAIVMERASRGNQFGAVLVMKEFLDWVNIYVPEYLK